jgi:allophanate hydrolase subunit 2
MRLEDKYVPSFPEYNEIRVVSGLQGYLVSNVNEFHEVTWEMSTMGSRVGYRFLSKGFAYRWARQERGEPQPFGAAEDPCDTILIPYPIGSIQTDMWNEAIVVLEDAISVGGFVSLCTVIPCDLDTVGQAKPGDKVKFIPVSREQALHARKERYELLNRIRESCLTS